MSFNKLDSLYDDLQNIINDSQSDVTKFVEGNNSAGTRVRKAMQAVKQLAQDVTFRMKKGIAITVIPFFYNATKKIVIINTTYNSGLRSICCVSINIILR